MLRLCSNKNQCYERVVIYEHEKTDTLVKRTPTVGPCLSQFTPFI